MKVLLKEDVENLGYAGEVYEVANGYGRNYLIPKNLAIKATPGSLKAAAAWRKQAEARRAELHAEYEALSAQIREVSLTFQAKAGETGKLYGSVTTTQIADKLNEILGTDIDRRKVGHEPLRQLGSHQVVVRLSGDFQPELTVVIESEDGVAAPEAASSEAVAEESVVAETEEPASSQVEEQVASVTEESPSSEAEESAADETDESVA